MDKCVNKYNLPQQTQKDKEKHVSPIYPWGHMRRTARETGEQPHKLLPLHEASRNRIISL